MLRISARTRHLAASLAAVCALAACWPARAQSAADAAPSMIAATTVQTAGKIWSGAQDVAVHALGLIGVEYRYGGNTPESGLDCSGLVRHVFQEVTGFTLPRTSREMSRLGARVSAKELQAGDLVFFNTRRFQFSHVGIYLGDDRFIHAPFPRQRGRDRRAVQIVLAPAFQWRAAPGRRAAVADTQRDLTGDGRTRWRRIAGGRARTRALTRYRRLPARHRRGAAAMAKAPRRRFHSLAPRPRSSATIAFSLPRTAQASGVAPFSLR